MPTTKTLLETMLATDGDEKNLLVTYYLSKNKKYTDEEKAYLNSHKEDFLKMKEGLEKGVPLLYCINQKV